MAFRFTDATSSPSLVRLPICELIPVLQEKSLQVLHQCMFDMVCRIDPNKLHGAFVRVRLSIDDYLKKQSLMGIESAFDGYIGLVSDNNRCNGFDIGNGEYIKLSPEHLTILLNIIKVYRAYAIQQFKIKARVDAIRLLEFPEKIYANIKNLYKRVGELSSGDKTKELLSSFNLMMEQITRSDIRKNNEILDRCNEQLQGDRKRLRKVLREKSQAVDKLIAENKETYADIGTRVMSFDGVIQHDLPDIRATAARCFAEIQGELNALKQRKNLVSAEEIAELRTRFLEEKRKYAGQNQEFLNRRAALLRDKKTFQDNFAQENAKKIQVARTLSQIPLVNYDADNIPVNIADESSFAEFKNRFEKVNKLYLLGKKNEKALESAIELVKEFLKKPTSRNVSGSRQSFLAQHWADIMEIFASIMQQKIELKEVVLDDAIKKYCSQACDIDLTCLMQARHLAGDIDRDLLESEIACMEADAHCYLIRLQECKNFVAILLKKLDQYNSLIYEINSSVRGKLHTLYESAQLGMNADIDAAKTAISSKIEELKNYHPELPDIMSKESDIWIVEESQLTSIEKQLSTLEKAQKKAQLSAHQQEDRFAIPKRRPSRPGFFKRHLGFIIGATVVTGALGLLAGAALAAGIILAPATFGLSLIPASAACIGIGVGVGIAVALGVTLTGSVMACAACGVADACCQPAPRQHQSEVSLLGGGSTAAVRRAVPVSKDDQVAEQTAEDLAGVAREIDDYFSRPADEATIAPSSLSSSLAI